MEFYLSVIPDHSTRKTMSKFRVSDHKLQIEVGRHNKIPLHERTCTKCQLGAVEDECHVLLLCPAYILARENYLSKIRLKSPHIDMLEIQDKFEWLIGNQDKYIIIATANFISNIMKLRAAHPQDN
jgi:hypothetical protein